MKLNFKINNRLGLIKSDSNKILKYLVSNLYIYIYIYVCVYNSNTHFFFFFTLLVNHSVLVYMRKQ
jgi:hypothetical protein